MAIKFNVIRRDDSESARVSERLINCAIKEGFSEDILDPEFVFCVGGDGTFLKAVHTYITKLERITFVGIHTGSLGFFSDFHEVDIEAILALIKKDEINSKDYRLVKAEIVQNRKKHVFYAVNEIRIENVHHTLVLNVELNGETLETYRGNGILVATQLGSSGYNKSLGGALINRDLDLLEYTKIAPIANSVYHPLVNPLIISGKDKLTFTGRNDFTYFGRDHLTLKLEDASFKINVSLSGKKVRIMHKKSRGYAQILNEAFLGGK